MKEFIKEKNGITLIALVITIVILIILAGVLINLTISNNGLFTRTKLAKQKYEYAQIKEQIEITLTEVRVECYTEGKEYNAEEINNKADNLKNASIIKIFKDDSQDADKVTEVVMNAENNPLYKFLIGNNGNIEGVTTENITNETTKSVFSPLQEFETEIFGQVIQTEGKKMESYHIGDELVYDGEKFVRASSLSNTDNMEHFYVFEDSDSNNSVVKIISKYCLNTGGNAQLNSLNGHATGHDAYGCRFSNSNYWSTIPNIEYPYNLQSEEGLAKLAQTSGETTSNNAILKSHAYGDLFNNATGRLMDYETEAYIIQNGSNTLLKDILWGTWEGTDAPVDGYLQYVLGAAGTNSNEWYVSGGDKGLYDDDIYNHGILGVRPILIVEK